MGGDNSSVTTCTILVVGEGGYKECRLSGRSEVREIKLPYVIAYIFTKDRIIHKVLS